MKTKRKIKAYNLNFGPQHPSAHGVLRLILELNGEIVKKADPHIGLLHRGTEKLLEYKTVLQGLPYLDRLDYVSMMAQEHCYSLIFEKILDIEVPISIQYTRVLFLELTRILNHLMAITAHALDVGALTPFLWAFEEREKIMEFYEYVSGARMHAAFIRPGGVYGIVTFELLNKIYHFCWNFNKRLQEIEELLSTSRVWKNRLVGTGIIKYDDAINYGFSGVMLRCTGTTWDLRKEFPYEVYSNLKFMIPTGFDGDSFTRYALRIQEMYESLQIVYECLDNITESCIYSKKLETMEDVIAHFKYYSLNFLLPKSVEYLATESPKGEFGIFLVANGTNKPERMYLRAPGYFHLQGLDMMTRNGLLSDLVTIIGSQDIVFGEIDR